MRANSQGDIRSERLAPASDLATFYPGYFALVMATGIVSLAAHLEGRDWIALGLFGFNIISYPVLWCLALARFIRFRRLFINDLTDPTRGAAFLTKAAATCVLGSQFLLLTPWIDVAKALWFFGAVLWFILSYAFFTALLFCESKPSLEASINGGWLLLVVATESISVLGALVGASLPAPEVFLFIALATHLVGAMLYLFLATVLLYRWMFFSMRAEQLTPDYWIGMGALAITTLAGALLIEVGNRWTLLQQLAPFLTGCMLFFWATATWWIPLLLVAGFWRHMRSRVPFKYGPRYWAMVFPLGMYPVATFMLVRDTGLNFLLPVAKFFTYAALIVWAIVFLGMMNQLLRRLFRKVSNS